MARKKFSWSMYPKFHKHVQSELETEDLNFTYHQEDDNKACVKDYDTNVIGRFICRNKSCSSDGWASKVVAVTIRMYPDNEYNARVYHQRCRGCHSVARPILDKQCYAERVAYRLKKWKGKKVEQPFYEKKNTPPHEGKLCEGCKVGRCKQGGLV